MKKYRALYKAMYDDLKDSEMMIDYAYCIKEEDKNDTALADEIAKYAQYRLEHFMSFHKLFQEEARKSVSVTEETVSTCMWKEAHEGMQDWYESIKRKIEKY